MEKSSTTKTRKEFGGKGYRLGKKEKNPDNQMSRLYIKGIGMMAGLIIGAGVCALPYAFSQAGVFWGNGSSGCLIVYRLSLAPMVWRSFFLHQRGSTALSDMWKCI